MRLEIPQLNRCFMCFGLRYGIIIFGYLNLLFALLIITVESAWLVNKSNGTVDLATHTIVMYKGVSFSTHSWLLFLLYVTEVVFNVILLIGAHTKRVQLMNMYYNYGITTLFASIVTFLVVELIDHWFNMDPLSISITFIGLTSHVYLLLLVRSEISKPRYEVDMTHQYENHLNHQYPPNWREPDII